MKKNPDVLLLTNDFYVSVFWHNLSRLSTDSLLYVCQIRSAGDIETEKNCSLWEPIYSTASVR